MRSRTALRLGAIWTLLFAAAHVYWAAGGRAGMPATATPIDQRPAFLAYDVVSAVTLIAAAAIAMRLIRRPTPLLVRATAIGAGIALLRGVTGLAQDALGVAQGHGVTVTAVYDVWFVSAGALFLTVVLTASHTVVLTASHTVAPVRTVEPGRMAPVRTRPAVTPIRVPFARWR